MWNLDPHAFLKIRLYDDERIVLLKLLKSIKGEVYLFGSRVDEQRKGGDIDLLILSSDNPVVIADQLKTQFFLALDSKLDVVVFNPTKLSAEQSSFINTLNKIRLK